MKLAAEAIFVFLLSVCIFTVLFVFAPAARGQDITLTWTAPTENEDGTPLDDLAGYTVHYGQTSRAGQCGERPTSVAADTCYPNHVQVTEPNTLLTLNLSQTTLFYWTVTAYDEVPNVSRWATESTFLAEVPDTTPPAPPTSLTIRVNP